MPLMAEQGIVAPCRLAASGAIQVDILCDDNDAPALASMVDALC
jgi:hypothetical protein